MRVAIVHDYLVQFGGAERVLQALMELYPNAPVYTLLYDKEGMRVPIDERRLRLSWLQKVPGAKRHHRYFPLLMPLAAEQFDFKDFDVVLSATHSFSKGIITGAQTMHISYCFTPTRYVWDDCHRYMREFSRLAFFKRLAPLALSYIRLWDYYGAQRADAYLTLSQGVAQRIRKYYRREAAVLPPPVEVDQFRVSTRDEGYYLVVSRLVPYKRVELAVEACERLGRPLKIVGMGPEIKFLQKRAGSNTEFLGFVDSTRLKKLYAGAKAFLFPQEEDFGIAPLEAAASGKATIAYAAGGALETIIDGETGIFFHEQTAEALEKAIEDFERRRFNAWRIRKHAEEYGKERFLRALGEAVHTQWEEYRRSHSTRL